MVEVCADEQALAFASSDELLNLKKSRKQCEPITERHLSHVGVSAIGQCFSCRVIGH